METVYWGLIFILVAVAAYTVLPDVLLHRLGIGSWKRVFGPGVCLTFDDGPNPEFTPQVLDTLSRHSCKATFFLVAEQAVKYPELVEKIILAGHAVGIHGLKHRYAWFMTPWATWREWDEATRHLEKICRQPVALIRPPWGTFNLATWLWCLARRKRIVLWTAEGHDWQAKRAPQDIAARICGKVREGSIVVMHDSRGEDGAPRNSLVALDLLCQQIVQEKKLPLQPLEFPNWSIWRMLVFVLWEYWERIFAYFNPTMKISSRNVFKLAKIKYSGPTIYGEKGEILAQTGDTVCELHLESIRLAGNNGDVQKLTFQAVKQFKASMPELATYVATQPELQEIKVFLGFSFLNRGVQLLGFQVQEISKSWFNHWIGLIQKGVLRVYHPMGSHRGTQRLSEDPKLVWISREALLDKWLPRPKTDKNIGARSKGEAGC